jgi:hypothetical protein
MEATVISRETPLTERNFFIPGGAPVQTPLTDVWNSGVSVHAANVVQGVNSSTVITDPAFAASDVDWFNDRINRKITIFASVNIQHHSNVAVCQGVTTSQSLQLLEQIGDKAISLYGYFRGATSPAAECQAPGQAIWHCQPVEFSTTASQPFWKTISPAFSPNYISAQQLVEAVGGLVLQKSERNKRIAERLTSLYQDATAEGEIILAASIRQLSEFFLVHSDLGLPKITLTPDRTLRARWIHGKDQFTAVEFTGKQTVKFVAEIPRSRGFAARYFSTESIDNVVGSALALGASFK